VGRADRMELVDQQSTEDPGHRSDDGRCRGVSFLGKGTARRELAGVGRDGVSGHCGAPACGGGGREAHGELISGVHGVEKGLDAAAAARSRAWRW